ncbi:PREDICTED: extensin-like [Nicotiana attenuata]|uniref:extensin-like n=1 Tax=Nicotiana attenuata TaxID=49451 RepID=UPI000904B0EF|nr:PREDICTED: extensin-like [Nicotiana attenuata]
MYQAWAKGQPPPAYPANPAFIPPLAQSQDHPATDSSPGFPIYQHYQSTTSQTPPAPPPKPVLYPPPPATPVFVASLPATLHRSSSEPLFQAHDNQYYPRSPLSKLKNPIPTLLTLSSRRKSKSHLRARSRKRCFEK